MTDLAKFIIPEQSEILNTDKKFPEVFGRRLTISSDTDEEILIHLSFKQAVQVKEIVLYGSNDQAMPRELQVFDGSVAFDKVKSLKPAYKGATNFKLQASSHKIPLNQLTSTSSITLFIPGNLKGEETTQMQGFAVFGLENQALDVRGHKFGCGG